MIFNNIRGPLVFALGIFLAIPSSMAQISCDISLGLSINTATMSTIIANIRTDNINPPLANPLPILPDTFEFLVQPGGNAVTCAFNNFATGTADIVLATWASTTQAILGICGSVGGSEQILGTTGLEISVQNAQLGFGLCGEQAETIVAELGHPNDPSMLVTGTVAANGTVLSVKKHSI
ncbi:hypothetical protein C8R45DRAFT_990004, partial [Mycena sanguinolenta]